MFLFGAAFAFFALLALEQLGMADVTQRRAAEPANGAAIDSHDGGLVEMLHDRAT